MGKTLGRTRQFNLFHVLFNDAVSSSGYIASNGGIINQ
jgi:hypothetical protein